MVISFYNRSFSFRYKRAWFKQTMSKYTWSRKINFLLNLTILIDQYCHHHVIEYKCYDLFQFLYYRSCPQTQKTFLSDVFQEIDTRSSLLELFMSSGGGKILSILETAFGRIFWKCFYMCITCFFCKHIKIQGQAEICLKRQRL